MEKLVGVSILLLVLLVAIPIMGLIFIELPAQAKYNKRFGAHVTMAYDQASFEGVREQIMILWENMNESFGTSNLENIYRSPWYWQQTYDNSLKAQEDYFRYLIERIDKQIKESEDILAGNKTILVPYNQWYQQALDSLRTEMQREGGLDWAICGAWYLTYAPMAYWLWYWVLPIELLLLTILGIIWIGGDY